MIYSHDVTPYVVICNRPLTTESGMCELRSTDVAYHPQLVLTLG